MTTPAIIGSARAILTKGQCMALADCFGTDRLRESLHHACIRDGYAWATDGRVMARIPVGTDPEAPDVYLSRDMLKAPRKASDALVVDMASGQASVCELRLANDPEHAPSAILPALPAPARPFPASAERIIPRIEGDRMRVDVNGALMEVICKAAKRIGSKHNARMRTRFTEGEHGGINGARAIHIEIPHGDDPTLVTTMVLMPLLQTVRGVPQ